MREGEGARLRTHLETVDQLGQHVDVVDLLVGLLVELGLLVDSGRRRLAAEEPRGERARLRVSVAATDEGRSAPAHTSQGRSERRRRTP